MHLLNAINIYWTPTNVLSSTLDWKTEQNILATKMANQLKKQDFYRYMGKGCRQFPKEGIAWKNQYMKNLIK